MKAAAKIALTAAVLAAAGVLLTAVLIVTAASRSLFDMELRTAADDFQLYFRSAEQEFAQRGLRIPDGTDTSVMRYLLQSVSGSQDIAVEADGAILFNDTGFAARDFLLQHGTPYRQNGALVYCFADTLHGPRLVLGFGLPADAQGDYFSICLVRDISATAAEVRKLVGLSILIGGSALLACWLAIVFSVQRMLQPVTQVGSAMSALAQGFYDVSVEISGHDEFARLAKDCNRMASAIAGKVHQLDQLAEDRRFLLRSLAHEIRTPITVICAYAQTLQSLRLDDMQKSSALSAIRKQSHRLERLCTKMTQLVRADLSKPALEKVQAVQLTADLREMLPAIAATSTLVIHAEPGTSYLADADLLQVLLSNLVENASRAGADHIEIALMSGCIVVSDNGRGIEARHLKKIFEPFYQVEASRSAGGFGLGLALASRIAALHRASLSITSTPGKGTQITIVFESLQPTDDSSTAR